jgi:hypothetical protein
MLQDTFKRKSKSYGYNSQNVFPDAQAFNLQMLTTPWGRVLLEKPSAAQLFKKFPTFYET